MYSMSLKDIVCSIQETIIACVPYALCAVALRDNRLRCYATCLIKDSVQMSFASTS